eukprot:2085377-Amphidinium_carterae.1
MQPVRPRIVYKPGANKRKRSVPVGLEPDVTKHMDLARQLVYLSVSWAPHAGLARGVAPDVAQRLLTHNSAA